jgi:predicted aminopeptidase
MLRDSPWRPIRPLAATAAAIVLGGCYYAHIAAGQLEMNSRRVPIAEVVADPATDATLRRRLEFAVRARDFAMAELGLPDNGSYRAFADLGRRYATWNLFAAPELAIEPKRWCFPIAGCVSYRGYFDEAHAERAAARLGARGYDTWIGPSIAYSTLGHLRDPVLNTMLGYGDAELAAFIFHELAHQAAYAPGDSDFNEAFAMVVESEGLERWFAREGPAGALEKFLIVRQRQRDSAALMVDTRRRLAGIYARTPDAAAARELKAAELARLREALVAGGHPATGEFNNARLTAVATYERCVPALRVELDRLGNDLPTFYAAMKQLEDNAPARSRLCPAT